MRSDALTPRFPTWRLILAAAILLAGLSADAQEIRFFRIGTGGTGGTYFPVGGLIANVISNPPGSMDCDLGGSCGVPGLIAAAVATQGSVENVRAVASGQLDMGLSQADVAYNAYSGKGVFSGAPPLDNLRAVTNLYAEAIHLVARAGIGIQSVRDLEGKRVSVGEESSGTRVGAQAVLKAYGLTEKDLQVFYAKLGTAGDMLSEGKLDAYFMVGGYPLSAIAHTADGVDIVLVPISSEAADTIVKDQPFFVRTTIPASTYTGVAETETLSVGAQLIVAEAMAPDLVYGILSALYHPNTQRLFERGHPNARRIRLETALNGIVIPLHPGAARFYEEMGLSADKAF